MGTIPDGSEPSQPKRKQLDLFQDYGQHTRATRRDALKAERKPKIPLIIDAVRSMGRHGATRYEVHELTGILYQTVCRPCCDLVNDHTFFHNGELRKTPHGRNAAVMVHADFAGAEVAS